MIYEKGLIKAMKQEYGKAGGYTVANDGQSTWFAADTWFAGVPNENMSNEIKSVIVLHFGRLPFGDEALSVEKKGDVQAELMETCMEVPDKVVDADGVRYRATYVRLGECLVFQDDALHCRMAHENNLLPIDYAYPVRLVSGWLVSDNDCFGVAGCAISDDGTGFLQAQLRHLEMMDWRQIDG